MIVPGAVQTRPRTSTGRRIVLTTFGSFGDLHPYIALGIGLRERGHEVVLCTSRIYRDKIEGEGLEFAPLRPELPPGVAMIEMVRRIMDAREGSEYVISRVAAPAVREQYEDVSAAAAGADLLVTHCLTFATRLLAEKRGLPWVAVILQPMLFVSAYDPPVPPAGPPALRLLHHLPPWIIGPLMRKMKALTRPQVVEVDRFRAELGLPLGAHPIFEGQFSPYLNLALFSEVLGKPQRDWPAKTVQTGFPWYDRREASSGIPADLLRFLESGPAPIVFTLGSSAVWLGTDFYVQSARAAVELGRRAVFLTPRESGNKLPDPLPEGIFVCDYAPHSELFPRAAAVVIQGGVGTCAQALRAGKPTLVVPFAHDQPDNALRMMRAGVARSIPANRYSAAAATRELRLLLDDPRYAETAERVGRKVRSEDGTRAACDAVEGLLTARV